jgi:hypothetical protein
MRGLELSDAFYREAVRPILVEQFPDLRHTAALIGAGSEVLGFDDEMSTDHHWGARVQLFLSADDHATLAETLHATFTNELPHAINGYSTHWTPPDLDDGGTQHPRILAEGPINHRVEIFTIRDFIQSYLGFDVHGDLDSADWLTFPSQRLRALTSGAIYHDGIGLQSVRDHFAWYPHDIWLYLLACGWERIGQEEHLMGRAGLVGDEIGSALIGARLVRDVMRLCFLMEKVYAPYPKWFGTAFKQLDCAPALLNPLHEALAARTWQVRESHLVIAYKQIAQMHNALGITDPTAEDVSLFHGRPFQVIAQNGFSSAIMAQISDPAMQQLAERPPIGSIDLFSDNTDLLENVEFRPKLRQLYQ